MSLKTAVRLSAVGSLLFVVAAAGQGPHRLEYGGCDGCSIRLDPLLTIGYGADEYGGVTRGYLVKDSRGRYYHTGLYTPWAVLVFDSSGVFLKAIGREGDGPGEFRNIYRAAIGPNDSLYVYDQNRRDITVLDSDYRYARTIPIGEHVSQMSIGPSGSILVNGDFRTCSGFAYPFHHLDSSGAIRSFGKERLGDRTGRINRLVLRQPFARADSDTFWAVDATTYWQALQSTCGSAGGFRSNPGATGTESRRGILGTGAQRDCGARLRQAGSRADQGQPGDGSRSRLAAWRQSVALRRALTIAEAPGAPSIRHMA